MALADLLTAIIRLTIGLDVVLAIAASSILMRGAIKDKVRGILFANAKAWRRIVLFFVTALAISWLAMTYVVRGLPLTETFLALLALVAIFSLFGLVEIIRIGTRYLSVPWTSNERIAQAIRTDLRRTVMELDAEKGVGVGLDGAGDIFQGRPTLGPEVSLSHYRAVLLGMTNYLNSRFGLMGTEMIYSMGHMAGRDAMNSMIADNRIADPLTEFLHAITEAKIGRLRVAEHTDDRFVVEVTECALCAGTRSDDHKCLYLGGVIAGVFEALWKEHVDSREVTCCGRGDEACRYEIEKSRVS